MEFRDLKKQYQVVKSDMDEAIREVVASGSFIMGKPVKELEAALCDYVGVKHCITCANGTEALTIALKVLGIGKGDAVFVPDFTFFASAEVISLEGATPVFVDVDEETFNMSPSDLEKKIKECLSENLFTPKAIITVDLFGLPANYPAIRKIANAYNLYIVEDGAQGFGGSISGKKACGFGDISTTSFFPAKPLGCYGDGGAVFTDNEQWAALADSLRVHGKGTFKYDNVRIGLNSRLDTIQAAILLVKLKAFKEHELTDVNKAAALYTEKLKDYVTTPVIPEGFESSWAQYTIQLKDKESRDRIQTQLKEVAVPAMVYYPKPMHAQTAYNNHYKKDPCCPSATKLCDVVLSLPMHPYITEGDIDLVCRHLIDFL